jgi:glycosyltransferase involved in cell wall biosynthesis
MKIVVIGTRGFPDVQGGVEKHCQQIYPLLAGMGVNVTVLTRRPYVDPSLREYRGVQLIPVNCPQNKFLEAIVHSFRAVFYARKLKPDVLHIHAIGPSIVVPLARSLGLKVVITHHGPDYERKKWNGVAKAVLMLGEACGCLFANRIITITGHIARSITSKFGRIPAIIPNGVVIPAKIVAAETVAGFGLEPEKYFLAVGRFVPEKGFHDLVDAYARMGAVAWKLVIVGDADHEDVYSRSLKEKAATVPGVVLTGFLTGKALGEIYSNAGVFVLPSYYEGLPIVLLEAMSYGLNCLVSDIPANREVPLAQERYVKPGVIDAWAQKMALFSSSPLKDDERSSVLELIAREYDWKDIARRTLAIYQSV